jgi:hypothetical protein
MVQLVSQKSSTAPTSASDGRGSGRRAWYRLQVGGYEPVTAADGTVSQEFIMDGCNIQVDAGGWFGWGVRDAIEQAAAEQFPGKQLIDWWPLSTPPVDA